MRPNPLETVDVLTFNKEILNRKRMLFEWCICNFIVSFGQFPVDLITFTEEILNGKLHFLCNV